MIHTHILFSYGLRVELPCVRPWIQIPSTKEQKQKIKNLGVGKVFMCLSSQLFGEAAGRRISKVSLAKGTGDSVQKITKAKRG
jgi:hypothetical protein